MKVKKLSIRLAEGHAKKNIASPSLNASNGDYKFYLYFLNQKKRSGGRTKG